MAFFAAIASGFALVFGIGAEQAAPVQPAPQQTATALAALATSSSFAHPVAAVAATTTSTTTVVNNYITQPVIERVVQAGGTATGTVSESELSTKLNQLDNKLTSLFYTSAGSSGGSSPSPAQNVAANGNGGIPYAAGQAINQLSGVTISNSTIDGASIPDLSGKYLSLNGGTVVGTTTFSGGNVGIGTTTPWARLSVEGSGTGTDKAFTISDSSNSTRMVVQDNGLVGIGTTNPLQPLEVSGYIIANVPNTSWDRSNIMLYRGAPGTEVQIGALGTARYGTGGAYTVFLTNSAQGTRVNNQDIMIAETGYVGVGFPNKSNNPPDPFAQLEVRGPNNTSASQAFLVSSYSRSPLFSVRDDGYVGVGTTSPNSLFEISGIQSSTGLTTFANGVTSAITNRSTTNNTFSRLAFKTQDATYGSATSTAEILGIGTGHTAKTVSGALAFLTQNVGTISEKMRIASNGNVGIGTTNPATFKLQIAGNVGPDASNSYNLGAAGSNWGCLYYNGGTTGTCASDERLKTGIQPLTFDNGSSTALSQLAGLTLHSFAYKTATSSIYHGLIAQEVQKVAPELVAKDASTTLLSVKYGDIQWLVVQALQELITKFNALANIVSGFANKFTTNELCVGNTCVTPEQFQKMVAAANASGTAGGAGQASAAPAGATATASLVVSGNNPIIWNLGKPWKDNLGALFTHGTSETIYSTSTVDTTAAGTTTIDYWASYRTDPGVATSTVWFHATRQVLVQGTAPVTTATATTTGSINGGVSSSTATSTIK